MASGVLEQMIFPCRLATERVLIHGTGLALVARNRSHSPSEVLKVARTLATVCSMARAATITPFCSAAP